MDLLKRIDQRTKNKTSLENELKSAKETRREEEVIVLWMYENRNDRKAYRQAVKNLRSLSECVANLTERLNCYYRLSPC